MVLPTIRKRRMTVLCPECAGSGEVEDLRPKPKPPPYPKRLRLWTYACALAGEELDAKRGA